ncbi:GMP/IMP nucleotidase [Simiduia aestuariiviva]|uniref:Putative hydrolase of the HAD superfamily n=1 Tax=Simiduia aestuariiviva TaxID=1510459 RepID=A0A839UQ91_9GAMM|nr:GMP/IMP nucleotidase [Simiduia aestuariiviva]MBB3169953.1 putative hydrolase of the HAD superfamily [Simiduia aestuariiviva]
MTAPSLDWSRIDTVLLDMDGTLLDLHFDSYFWLDHLPARLAQIRGKPEQEIRAELYAHIRAIEGTLNWYCLDYWADQLQVDIMALKEEIKDKIQLRPHVAEFLQLLRDLGKKVVLITNSHPKGLDLKLEVTALDQWLDLIISSHEFQEPKEVQAFWTALLEREPFDPARALFVDDTERVLDSAKAFGVGFLLGIHQPDSQTPRRLDSYPAIDHFDELLPSLRAARG